jgi:hypothetical protein
MSRDVSHAARSVQQTQVRCRAFADYPAIASHPAMKTSRRAFLPHTVAHPTTSLSTPGPVLLPYTNETKATFYPSRYVQDVFLTVQSGECMQHAPVVPNGATVRLESSYVLLRCVKQE